MSALVKNPYLPKSRVTKIIAGEGIKPFSSELSKLGVSVIYSKNNENLQLPIINHADMVCNYIAYKTFVLDKHQKDLFNSLADYKVNIIINNDYLTAEYPNDAKLNCVRISDNLICNKKTVSKTILNFAYKNSLNIINVSQGYTKCSIAVVNENAIITDDIDIYNRVTKNGLDVLLVSKGDVMLPGYDYGFIGGCCGLISNNTMLFTGNLHSHKDHKTIYDFLNKYNVNIVCLSSERLIDIGSFIPIIEEKD